MMQDNQFNYEQKIFNITIHTEFYLPGTESSGHSR